MKELMMTKKELVEQKINELEKNTEELKETEFCDEVDFPKVKEVLLEMLDLVKEIKGALFI